MSDKTDNFNQFLNSFKGKVIGAISLILVTSLIGQWDAVVHIFNTGQEVKAQVEFNDNLIKALKIDSVAENIFSDPDVVDIFFSSPLITNRIDSLGIQLKDNIADQIIKADTNKVSTRAYISHMANMHPDSVLPFQAKMVKFFKMLEDKGYHITTDRDLDELKDVLENQDIRTEPRRRRTNRASF